MRLQAIYAHLSCSDFEASIAWFAKLFGSEPDARPMDGLAEWHHEAHAGFQLYRNPPDAGRATMTLIVADLEAEHTRLDKAGVEVGEIMSGEYVRYLQVADPDGNRVVLA
ncbi:MAG: VOC family protein [Erythrobacter sp.]